MTLTLLTEGGDRVTGTYVRHLRTLTDNFGRGSNLDLDEYRLADGKIVQATSPSNDGRAMPMIVEERALADYR